MAIAIITSMSKAKFTRLCLLPAAAFLTACAGTHSVQIYTQPPGAKIYVNDKYVGVTPTHIPHSWNNGIGEVLKVTVAKDGYKTRKETISADDLNRAWKAGHASALTSEYGFGNSYAINYPLEPVDSTAPAAAPTLRVEASSPPAIRRSRPALPEPAKPRPPSAQAWR
jgi:hypothetical protein